MKVSELISELQDLPPDSQVILAHGSEEYPYTPASYVQQDMIYVDNGYRPGEVYDPEDSAKDAGETEEDWQTIKEGPRCVGIS